MASPRTRRLFAASLWLGFATLSANTLAGTAVVPTPGGVTITVGQQGSDTLAGLVASHLLDDAPYHVQFATFQSPTATLTALAAGHVDMANNLSQWTLTQAAAAASPPWTARTAPYKTVLVTGPDKSVPLDRFVIAASRASGITDIHQAKGKRWGIIPGSSLNLFAYTVLNKLGWSTHDVQIVNLDGTNQALALQTGQVDVLFNVTDNVAGAVQHGARIIGSARDYGMTIYTGFQANARAIDDPIKGKAIEDFVRRLVIYQNWLVLHPGEQQAALVQGLHLTSPQAEEVYKYTRLIPIAPGEIASYSQQLSDFALSTGLIHQHVDAAALLDNRYGKLIDETVRQTSLLANLKNSYR